MAPDLRYPLGQLCYGHGLKIVGWQAQKDKPSQMLRYVFFIITFVA
jgi:hypothetical protein